MMAQDHVIAIEELGGNLSNRSEKSGRGERSETIEIRVPDATVPGAQDVNLTKPGFAHYPPLLGFARTKADRRSFVTRPERGV